MTGNDRANSSSGAKPLNTTASWGGFLIAGYGPALLLVMLTVWLHASDGLVVATMMPVMVTDIGGVGLISWTVSLYELGSIFAGASVGLVTIKYGLKAPMAWAAVIFAVGCAVNAASPNMELVLVARLIQGVGGGGLAAMGFVAVTVMFPERYMARAIAAMSGVWGASAFMGPLIGGLFVQFSNWRVVFAMFAILALGLAVWITRQDLADATRTGSVRTHKRVHVPFVRLVLLGIGILAVLVASIQADTASMILCCVVGLLMLAWFVRMDARMGANRMLPLGSLDIGTVTGAGVILILSLSLGSIAMSVIGPLVLTTIHGASELTAGYVLAAGSIGWTVGAVLTSGQPSTRDRQWIIIGVLIIAISVLARPWTVVQGPVWLIGSLMGLSGFGFGMCWAFIMRQMISAAIDEENVHRIAAAVPTVQRIGIALGAALTGLVVNIIGVDYDAYGVQITFWVFIASLPFIVLALFALRLFVR